MNKRISLVNGLVITSVAESSNVRIGDTNEIHAAADVLAVQQVKAYFDEAQVENFSKSFQKQVIPFPQFSDDVAQMTFHEYPFIKVGPIRVIGVSTASTVHIGSLCQMYGQSHVLHIRQLPKENA